MSLDAQCKIWILKQRLMADWCQYSWMTFDKDTSQWITELWWQLRLLSSEFICVCVLLCPHKKLQAVLLLLRDFPVSNAPPHSVSLLPSPPWGQQQFYCHPVNTAAHLPLPTPRFNIPLQGDAPPKHPPPCSFVLCRPKAAQRQHQMHHFFNIYLFISYTTNFFPTCVLLSHCHLLVHSLMFWTHNQCCLNECHHFSQLNLPTVFKTWNLWAHF